jgi:hypothetical protein
MSKEIPLINRMDDSGKVVGTAVVHDDGTIDAKITDPEVTKFITGDVSGYSLGFKDEETPEQGE